MLRSRSLFAASGAPIFSATSPLGTVQSWQKTLYSSIKFGSKNFMFKQIFFIAENQRKSWFYDWNLNFSWRLEPHWQRKTGTGTQGCGSASVCLRIQFLLRIRIPNANLDPGCKTEENPKKKYMDIVNNCNFIQIQKINSIKNRITGRNPIVGAKGGLIMRCFFSHKV